MRIDVQNVCLRFLASSRNPHAFAPRYPQGLKQALESNCDVRERE
jgi:hypothetical protein